ncbi:RmlC-like cupin domain-containing protein [Phellopilus nigrolimitatus]|nr:RmlC-like cupin domain-containing protein [Phellopilus nigrolimitatus]
MSTAENVTFDRPDRAPVRRVVTGHTPEGKAVVLEDAPIEPHPFKGSPSLFTDLFWEDSAKPSNDVQFRDLVKEHPEELFGADGSSFRVVEVPPGDRSPFHRTVSLDYGILMEGTLTLLLDDDKRVVLKPGDVVVQRGTIHGWINEGTEWTRMYFIMFPSQKVKVGEKELDTEFRI